MRISNCVTRVKTVKTTEWQERFPCKFIGRTKRNRKASGRICVSSCPLDKHSEGTEEVLEWLAEKRKVLVQGLDSPGTTSGRSISHHEGTTTTSKKNILIMPKSPASFRMASRHVEERIDPRRLRCWVSSVRGAKERWRIESRLRSRNVTGVERKNYKSGSGVSYKKKY